LVSRRSVRRRNDAIFGIAADAVQCILNEITLNEIGGAASA
jgi:hypothetical protein